MTEPVDSPDYGSRRLPEPTHPSAAPARILTGHAESVAVTSQSGRATGGASSGGPGSTTVTFRLRRPDATLVEVMLRGTEILGAIQEGDQVEVPDRPGRSGRIEVVEVRNLTTGATVKASGSPKSAGSKVFRVVFIVLLAIVLIMFIGVIFFIITSQQLAGPF